jgi:hypothetical protein
MGPAKHAKNTKKNLVAICPCRFRETLLWGTWAYNSGITVKKSPVSICLFLSFNQNMGELSRAKFLERPEKQASPNQ